MAASQAPGGVARGEGGLGAHTPRRPYQPDSEWPNVFVPVATPPQDAATRARFLDARLFDLEARHRELQGAHEAWAAAHARAASMRTHPARGGCGVAAAAPAASGVGLKDAVQGRRAARATTTASAESAPHPAASGEAGAAAEVMATDPTQPAVAVPATVVGSSSRVSGCEAGPSGRQDATLVTSARGASLVTPARVTGGDAVGDGHHSTGQGGGDTADGDTVTVADPAPEAAGTPGATVAPVTGGGGCAAGEPATACSGVGVARTLGGDAAQAESGVPWCALCVIRTRQDALHRCMLLQRAGMVGPWEEAPAAPSTPPCGPQAMQAQPQAMLAQVEVEVASRAVAAHSTAAADTTVPGPGGRGACGPKPVAAVAGRRMACTCVGNMVEGRKRRHGCAAGSEASVPVSAPPSPAWPVTATVLPEPDTVPLPLPPPGVKLMRVVAVAVAVVGRPDEVAPVAVGAHAVSTPGERVHESGVCGGGGDSDASPDGSGTGNGGPGSSGDATQLCVPLGNLEAVCGRGSGSGSGSVGVVGGVGTDGDGSTDGSGTAGRGHTGADAGAASGPGDGAMRLCAVLVDLEATQHALERLESIVGWLVRLRRPQGTPPPVPLVPVAAPPTAQVVL